MSIFDNICTSNFKKSIGLEMFYNVKYYRNWKSFRQYWKLETLDNISKLILKYSCLTQVPRTAISKNHLVRLLVLFISDLRFKYYLSC